MKNKRSEVIDCCHCGKPGVKNHGNDKYLHIDCKIFMHRENMRVSASNRIAKEREERIRYLKEINGNINVRNRRCIVCKKDFKSKGNHNRICSKCNCMIDALQFREPPRHRIHLKLNLNDIL